MQRIRNKFAANFDSKVTAMTANKKSIYTLCIVYCMLFKHILSSVQQFAVKGKPST